MRVLFHVTLTTMLRHFDGVIRELAARGHDVRVAYSEERKVVAPPPSLVDHERISFVAAPGRRGDAWAERIHELRLIRDYLHYLEPPFKEAPKLRNRALRKMVQAVTHDERSHLVAQCPHCATRLVDDEVGRMLLGLRKGGVRNLDGLLDLMESTIPSDAHVEAFLQDERPDVVVVTPLVNLGSYQADYVKSARALGLPVVFPVFSWDNLSTKGVVHVQPDLVLVWNEWQRREAVEFHGMAPDRIRVTGAPRFDEFFAMRPGTTREGFCRSVGLDPSRPIVTYLCSSEFVAGGEAEFVARWLGEIRAAPDLAGCGVLIRPHPREQKPWRTFEIADPQVTVSFPSSMNADQTLFDTLYHSAAVVGLNTSAQLEAAIVGRSVLTILAPEFASGQQGTLHFRYLLEPEGGFVQVAPDWNTHRSQLAAAVEGRSQPAIERFVERFLRPKGVRRRVTPIVADAIEACARTHLRNGALESR